MEGSDIAVPRIIAEILKLASGVHWLDESGERLLGKCRWHTAGGEGENFNQSISAECSENLRSHRAILRRGVLFVLI